MGKKAEEMPLRIQSVHRDMLFYQPPTTADLLGKTGEVFIQKSQLGGGSPMIRGFAANRILLVYDGIRVNMPFFAQEIFKISSFLTHMPWKARKLFSDQDLPFMAVMHWEESLISEP
jgi:hypothetical protein